MYHTAIRDEGRAVVHALRPAVARGADALAIHAPAAVRAVYVCARFFW